MKKLNFTWKIWLLIIVIAFSLISMFGLPPTFFQKGVLITSVDSNSTAFEQGLRQGQIITFIDEEPIKNLDDFTNAFEGKFLSEEKEKTIIQTTITEIILFSHEPPQITVSDVQKTNLKLGLDLAGGSRALVKAEGIELSSAEISDLVEITDNRLNVYGISDIKVSPVSDLEGNHFMLIEIAGATPDDLEELISKQGKFEAKIREQSVFVGGAGEDKDISSVCRGDPTCAGIESCNPASDSTYFCNFQFSVYLSEKAANKHFDLLQTIPVNSTSQGNYLAEKLDLYVDGKIVDSLLIGEGLKKSVTTQIAISGSGSGETQADAYDAAEVSMKKLQTILLTGSLPYKLEIVKLDTISPTLGKEFIKSILLAAFAALFAVALIVFLRYRNFKSSIALLITSMSEIIIILGIASFIDWNLDLPSLAGILATIGTGVDSQIIILDEARQKTILSLKQKLKRAFSIILGAYFTAVVALLPLLWAGAGLLKGFATATIIGITVGVLITRPAFTDMIRRIEE